MPGGLNRPPGRGAKKPMSHNHLARNGHPPDSRLGAGIAERLNHALIHNRKCVLTKARQFSTSFSTVPTANTDWWRFYFHSGYASTTAGNLVLYCEVMLLPGCSSSSSLRPRVRLVVNDGTTTTNSDWKYHSSYASSPTNSFNTIRHVSLRCTITPDTDYRCHLETEDAAQVLAATAYEIHPDDVSIADAIVCDVSSFGDGAPITDAQHKKICAENPHSLWKRNAVHLMTLVPDNVSGEWSTSSASYTDVVSDWKVHASTLYHNAVHSSTIPVKLAVYGRCDGNVGNNGAVRLQTNSSDSIEVSVPSQASRDWHTTTGTITPSSNLIFNSIQFKRADVNSIFVESICLFEYVA